MHIAQSIARNVCVDLSGADVGVAEKFLDDTQVGAVLQQMRGKTMAESVRRDVAFNARTPGSLLDAQP